MTSVIPTLTDFITINKNYLFQVAELDAMGLDVVETQSFATDVREALTRLREKDVRIILGNFNDFWARKVFCEAHR